MRAVIACLFLACLASGCSGTNSTGDARLAQLEQRVAALEGAKNKSDADIASLRDELAKSESAGASSEPWMLWEIRETVVMRASVSPSPPKILLGYDDRGSCLEGAREKLSDNKMADLKSLSFQFEASGNLYRVSYLCLPKGLEPPEGNVQNGADLS